MKKEKELLEDADLISQVRLRGLRPSQVFKSAELMEDDGFKQAIEAEVDYKLWLESKEIEEEIEKYEKKETEEYEKMKEENELIPDFDHGISKPEEDKPEQKKKKKESSDDNPFIPDDSDEGEGSDETNELIPD